MLPTYMQHCNSRHLCSQAPLRNPLPAPTGRLPPPPPGLPQSPPLPTTPLQVYSAMTECAAALQALHDATSGMTAAATSMRYDAPPPPGSSFPLTVNEATAIQRLHYYLGLQDAAAAEDSALHQPVDHVAARDNAAVAWPVNRAPVQGYKDARMQAVGVDSSTKLSPFLALGVLSPRTVAAEVLRARAVGVVPSDGGPGESFDWLLMHLAIRCGFLSTFRVPVNACVLCLHCW